jgi:2,4-dienoyl-CoA reductase-like NADH-dependent reductase (Old Yellow Enzyme family)/thioredoxin reductase
MAFDELFQPLQIGTAEIRCRIVSTSHQTTMVRDHLPTDEFVAYQQARARGGVGLIIMEAVAVSPSGLLTAHTLGGYLEDMVGGYRRVSEAVHSHGAQLFVQLFHGGREVISSAPRPVVVAASAIPSHRYHTEPRALTTSDVRDLISSYGRCAAIAAEAGIDGIEITAAHGYLFEQFFNSTYNTRDDEYAEPARALLDVVEAIRQAAPRLALGVRLSGDSEAAQAAVPRLAGVIDYVHVTTGNSATVDGCVGIVPPLPTPRNIVENFTAPFRIGVPLIATARVVEPADANAILQRGSADAIGMNRALITDPEMPNKARAGRDDEILRCIACNACIAHYHAETPLRCAQNPRTGRELTLPRAEPGSAARRILVVGGGPAGMAAAVEAGARGHEVVLLERNQLGGQVRLAGKSPTHAELAESMMANYERLLPRSNVRVELGVDADADLIESHSPDAVIIAAGARPFDPPHALSGVEVVQVWDLLAGFRPEGHILIADWGGDAAALDCAEALAAEGRKVTLAVGAVTPGETLHQYSRNVYIGRLLRAGVRIENWLALQKAEEGRASFRNIFAPDLETSIPCDVLALSLGRVPNQSLEADLRARGIEVETAGDCRSPRTIEEAVLEGTLAAMTLSRVPTPATVS